MYCDNILCVLCECMTLSVVEFDLYFRSFERTIPVWFKKIVSKKDQSASQFLSDKKKLFSLANTHSIMDVITNHENIASHTNFFYAAFKWSIFTTGGNLFGIQTYFSCGESHLIYCFINNSKGTLIAAKPATFRIAWFTFYNFCYAAMSKQSKAGSRTCFRLIETNFKIS